MKKSVYFLCILLYGCVGGGPIYTEVKQYPNEKNTDWSCPRSDVVGFIKTCSESESSSFTREKIESMWGKPRSTGKDKNLDYMTYQKNGLAWSGFVMFAIIPVPLVLPVGHYETKLFFENNHLVKVLSEYQGSHISICGLHTEQNNDIACIADW